MRERLVYLMGHEEGTEVDGLCYAWWRHGGDLCFVMQLLVRFAHINYTLKPFGVTACDRSTGSSESSNPVLQISLHCY